MSDIWIECIAAIAISACAVGVVWLLNLLVDEWMR